MIATDTQKNTVFVLAKLFGVKSPEEFSLLVGKHFLKEYPWVRAAKVEVKVFPWEVRGHIYSQNTFYSIHAGLWPA